MEAIALLEEWVQSIGSQAGLTSQNATILSGAVGVPESRLEARQRLCDDRKPIDLQTSDHASSSLVLHHASLTLICKLQLIVLCKQFVFCYQVQHVKLPFHDLSHAAGN